MKTSEQTAVNEIIRKIAEVNRDLIYLKECSECAFRTPAGQFRIQITDNMPGYELMKHTLLGHLNDKKAGMVEVLKSKYV